MKIIIIGGGKIGYYLAKTLIPFKHDITLIEEQKELCIKVANELNINVLSGDGTNIEILTEAKASEANVFIAVSGKDEVNLIACQLAKRNFAVNSTSIIADLIEQEVDYSGMKTLMKIRNSNLILSEIQITKNSPINNKSLKEINIPRDCILVSVIRAEEVIIPNGYTIIKDNDLIITVSSKEDEEEIKRYFIGGLLK